MNHLINLTNPESNFPPIKISTYPDSQISVEIEVWEGYANINSGDTFTILSRMSSYSDLIKIVAANQVLQENGMRTELDCPYILGARSDRRFKMTQSFDLKIVADIINSCNFDRVIVLDAHSDVLPAMINRCIVRQPNWWISEFSINWKDYLLISPDAGAYKKIFGLAESLGCELESGSKVRMPDGSPQVVIHGDVKNRHCAIIDDICDGGRTFVELGRLLKEQGAKSVTLFVTHGIFSKGIQLENIDAIYTTNSYQPFDETMQNDYFHFIDVFKS